MRKSGGSVFGRSGQYFLLCFASEVLGSENVIAVTAVASNFAPDEIDYAQKMAAELGVRHICVEAELPELFRVNPPDRCYYCKKAVFTALIEQVAAETGADVKNCCGMKAGQEQLGEAADGFVFCDGTNLDDADDYRPGSRAAAELGVRSPLREAKLTKSEIREELKKLGVSIWDKPAFACLASRIPYGKRITDEMLNAVYEIEKMLRDKGYTQVRARLHDEVVRLELLPAEMRSSQPTGPFARFCRCARGTRLCIYRS